MILDPEITIVRQIEIPEAFIDLRSDNIIHVHYKKNVILDIPLQTSMRKIFVELVNGKKMKFIFSADEGFNLTKEAREHAPKMDKDTPILCYAMIANNLAYKIIANFYIRVVKPKGNYKLFTTVESAVKWLHSIDDITTPNSFA